MVRLLEPTPELIQLENPYTKLFDFFSQGIMGSDWPYLARTRLGKQSMYVARVYSYIGFHLSFNLVILFPLPQGMDDSAESK